MKLMMITENYQQKEMMTVKRRKRMMMTVKMLLMTAQGPDYLIGYIMI